MRYYDEQTGLHRLDALVRNMGNCGGIFSIECGSLMTRKNVHAYFAPHEAKYLSLIVQGASRDADWMAGNSSDKIGYMYAYLSTNRPIAWRGDNKRHPGSRVLSVGLFRTRSLKSRMRIYGLSMIQMPVLR